MVGKEKEKRPTREHKTFRGQKKGFQGQSEKTGNRHTMLGLCYGLNVPVPQSSDAEVLTLDVTILRGGALGRDSGLDEVMRVETPR